MTHRRTLSLTALCLSALGLSACSSMGSHSMYSQAELPATVQVPAGHKVAMETVGVGQITYECRAKKDMAAEHEWVFVGPDAKLQTRSGTVIGKYWGRQRLGRITTAPRSLPRSLPWLLPERAISRCSWSRPILPPAWELCRGDLYPARGNQGASRRAWSAEPRIWVASRSCSIRPTIFLESGLTLRLGAHLTCQRLEGALFSITR